MVNVCDGCVLKGRCSGNCEDTNPTYYSEEVENDYWDNFYNSERSDNNEKNCTN